MKLETKNIKIMNLPKQIVEQINKDAFHYAKILYTYAKDEDIKESSQYEAYKEGRIEQLEKDLGFAIWLQSQDLKLYEEGWCQPGGSNGFHYSTSELYLEYIKTLKK